jgi:hypothetical protein
MTEAILHAASLQNTTQVLRKAAAVDKVDTDAIDLKVKQEFAAKDRKHSSVHEVRPTFRVTANPVIRSIGRWPFADPWIRCRRERKKSCCGAESALCHGGYR